MNICMAGEGRAGLLIAPEWNEFRNLDFERLRGLLKNHVLVNQKSIYEPVRAGEKGFEYVGVERS